MVMQDARSGGRCALVTGAGSGIGRATCVELAALGYAVVGVDLSLEGAQTTRELASGSPGSMTPMQVDVTDPAAVEALRGQVVARHGGIQALINVVGGAELATVEELDLGLWTRQVALNLTSVYLMCHTFLPDLLEAGDGAIVNTSSGWGFMPAPGRSAYSACKAGVVSFSRSLAAEVAPRGVRVNVVSPGPIETERMLALTAADPLSETTHARVPVGRRGQPSEVAAAIRYLISDEARFVVGQTLHVNGGVFMP